MGCHNPQVDSCPIPLSSPFDIPTLQIPLKQSSSTEVNGLDVEKNVCGSRIEAIAGCPSQCDKLEIGNPYRRKRVRTQHGLADKIRR